MAIATPSLSGSQHPGNLHGFGSSSPRLEPVLSNNPWSVGCHAPAFGLALQCSICRASPHLFPLGATGPLFKSPILLESRPHHYLEAPHCLFSSAMAKSQKAACGFAASKNQAPQLRVGVPRLTLQYGATNCDACRGDPLEISCQLRPVRLATTACRDVPHHRVSMIKYEPCHPRHDHYEPCCLMVSYLTSTHWHLADNARH
jgi:hypothetical protein